MAPSPFRRRPSGARLERMAASPRYKSGTFFNASGATPGLKPGTALSTMGKFLAGAPRRIPAGPLPALSPFDAWGRRPESGLRATWLGHSTVLLELDGWRVLTDPVWAERASPTQFAGPKRFQPVPVALDRLPRLDAVVLSHDHYDHLDAAAVAALAMTGAPIVTALGVGVHLEAFGVPPERIVELDWWEEAKVAGGALSITAAPSQHFSGRGLHDRNATLWSSMVIRSERHAVFFSGDTGLTPEYAEIRARLGPFDLVMLEVGAFHPSWGTIHLGPENALEALKLLGGGPFLPVHWGTFSLALHEWDEPVETLLKLAPRQDAQLVLPKLGEAVEPAHVESAVPWWREVAALESKAPATSGEPEPRITEGEPID